MVYLVGWLGMFLVSLLVNNKFGKVFGFVLLTYLSVIATCRGLVGTDTVSYISLFENLGQGASVGFSEVGFIYLSKLLLSVAPSATVAVNLVSLVFYFLISVFYYRANKNESFLLFSYLLPVFAYSYSMNALRIGLAFAVFILVLQSIRRCGFSAKRIVLFFTPMLFHFSAIVYPTVFFLHLKKWLSVRFMFTLVVLLSFVLLVFYLNSSYFLHKFANYEDFTRPHPLSGLRIVIPLFLILLGVSLCRLSIREKIKIIFISSSLIIFGLLLVQFSYAGLRVLDLFSAAIPLSVLYFYNKQNLGFDKNLKLFMLLAGVLSAIGIYRGFLLEAENGGSPFLPYYFSFIV